MLSKEEIKKIVGVRLREVEEFRTMYFRNYSKAVLFLKELLATSEEIRKISLHQYWTQRNINQPNIKASRQPLEMSFFYNSHNENNKKSLTKLLNKHKKDILLSPLSA